MFRRLLSVFLILALLLCTLPAQAATLRNGSRGSEVVRLQTVLKEQGYYRLAVDGKYGKGTIAAVRAFQQANGLKADGIAGPLTQGKLYQTSGSGSPGSSSGSSAGSPAGTSAGSSSGTAAEPAAGSAVRINAVKLQSGSQGSAVRDLQTVLKSMGYYNMEIDGKYGRGTAAAVKAYQRANGLYADGIAGPKTLGKLNSTAGSGSSGSSGGSSAGTSAGTTAPSSGEPGDITTAEKLETGSTGEAVKDLQNKLRYIGYYTGSVNGTFDAATREAVIAFQQANSLAKDGIAGKKTLTALQSKWAESKKNAGSVPDEAAVFLNRMALESGAACGTLVLSRDGKTFLTWSFGGVNEKTCFRIASITKWVTAIGLMTLYDQGKLDLDRDISEYLPFKVRNPAWPDTPVTARMLLSHTSSLSPDTNVYKPNWNNIGVNGYDPIFDESIRPGTKHVYADYNGALFGCLIEAISGESVQNYMSRTVFKPLGLTAGYSPNFLPAGTPTKDTLLPGGRVGLSVQSDRAAAYNNTADPRGNNGYTVGRLYINTESLTKLAQMMLRGGELNGARILQRETVSLMEADQPGLAASDYGLSNVRHSQFPRGTWYGHQGRYSGLTSNVYYQLDTGITMALVMNGYDYQLENKIVLPAVTLLRNMETLEKLCAQ